MENPAEIKKTLANFLGFAMSKSKELESAIVPGSAVSKNNTNIDYLITKAANEVEQKFSPHRPYASVEQNAMPTTSVDIAAALIPMPPREEIISASDRPSNVSIADDCQLEFNFVEPSAQTKLIIDEIKRIDNKLNKILSAIETKSPTRRAKK